LPGKKSEMVQIMASQTTSVQQGHTVTTAGFTLHVSGYISITRWFKANQNVMKMKNNMLIIMLINCNCQHCTGAFFALRTCRCKHINWCIWVGFWAVTSDKTKTTSRWVDKCDSVKRCTHLLYLSENTWPGMKNASIPDEQKAYISTIMQNICKSPANKAQAFQQLISCSKCSQE
jgi:hypothetical protein